MTVLTNKLVDEAGTGSPDFPNGMPTVDGVPIVESGSNSDGEWTKFADGTALIQSIFPSITTSSTGSWTWQYPLELTERCMAPAAAETANNSQIRTFQMTSYGTYGQSQTYYLIDQNGNSMRNYTTDDRVFCSGQGKWK